MGKLQKNQNGFSVVELVLILVIVGVIGGVGYYIYHANKNVSNNLSSTSTANPTIKKKTTPSTSTDADPYAGWTSAVLKYEKISYKYPSNWTVLDRSVDHPKSANACTYPGEDVITLMSPSHETVLLQAGVDCIGDGGTKSFGSVPINSIGQSAYLAFENNVFDDGTNGPTAPSFACLGMTSSPTTPLDFKSKNIYFNSTDGDTSPPANDFCYYPYDATALGAADQQPPAETVSSIENSTDFATAKLIFESMAY